MRSSSPASGSLVAATKALVRRSLSRVIRWATVAVEGDDSQPYPSQTIDYLGRRGSSVPWFPYGFHARAPRGSLVALLELSGQGGNRLHLPGSPRRRPRVAIGEVVVYHPETGSRVHFRSDGSIDVVATGDLTAEVAGDLSATVGGDVTLDAGGSADVVAAVGASVTAPTIELNGDVTVNGALTVTGATTLGTVVTSNGANISDDHVHLFIASPPTYTGPPV